MLIDLYKNIKSFLIEKIYKVETTPKNGQTDIFAKTKYV